MITGTTSFMIDKVVTVWYLIVIRLREEKSLEVFRCVGNEELCNKISEQKSITEPKMVGLLKMDKEPLLRDYIYLTSSSHIQIRK